jgi:hypothetical protein
VVSEVQPLHMRAAGTAFGTMVNFIMSFAVGQFFLTLMCHLKSFVFLFFAGERQPRSGTMRCGWGQCVVHMRATRRQYKPSSSLRETPAPP